MPILGWEDELRKIEEAFTQKSDAIRYQNETERKDTMKNLVKFSFLLLMLLLLVVYL